MNRQLLHNTSSRLVLRTIYELNPISRAEVSRTTGLTAPTVSEAVADLLEQGLIEETGLGSSTGGKRPTLLQVQSNSHHLIGLDLAKVDFRGAIINLRGEIQQRSEVPLSGRRGEAALALVFELLDGLVASANRPLLGIGIGAPGLINAANGIIRKAVNVEWHDLHLADLLRARYGLPVYLANDCQVAVLAEHLFGLPSSYESLVVISIGHGVGSGIIVNGKLLNGNPYGAGEIGHLKVTSQGELCHCGNTGCLETVTNTQAILRRLSAHTRSSPQALEGLSEDANLELLKQLCSDGDVNALQAIRETGHYLGIAAASIVSILGTCRILFAGSVTCFGKPLLDAVREEMISRCIGPVSSETEIGYTSVGTDIVLRGASVLVLSQEVGLL